MGGEHWLCLTLEEDGSGTFFDSFGFSPDFNYYPRSILQVLENRSNKILYHNRQLQHPLSVVCGQHCVYYLYHRACGLSFQQVLSLYHDDVKKNDFEVSDFVKKFQRCIRNRSSELCQQGACSLEMFKRRIMF